MSQEGSWGHGGGARYGRAVTLDDAADELAALAPSEFTAARDALVRRLRDEGDRELAGRVARLRRPSASAWVVTALVRAGDQVVDEAEALGERFREAQEAGDRRALTAASAERKALVARWLRRAREVACAADQPLSTAALEEVDATARAVVADRWAAAAVRTGRLVRGLRADGLGPVDLDGAVAGSGGSGRPGPHRADGQAPAPASVGRGRRGGRAAPSSGAGPDQEARRAAEEARRAAEVAETAAVAADEALERVEAARTDVEDGLADVDARRADLAGRLEELRRAFAALEEEGAALDREQRELEGELGRASAAVRVARREAVTARQRADRAR